MNEQTPRAERLHIAFYGRRNSGKSSLINALTGQQSAVVSATPGTTTDPVLKTMEIHGLGPCVLIDTPGFDDEGDLGALRVQQSRKMLDKPTWPSCSSPEPCRRTTKSNGSGSSKPVIFRS